MKTPPVLFILFNRADCARQSFAAIRAARPTKLYLAADGPRPSVPSDVERCEAARAAVESMVDWPCTVHRDYLTENIGPDRRIVSAINEVFRQEETAIIIEDDCVAGSDFFPFCAELLDRYARDARVSMISGCQFVDEAASRSDGASYHFVNLAQIWGWATWRRAWQLYDPAMAEWPERRAAGLLGQIFPRYHPNRRYWRRRFDACHSGTLAIWDYKWTFTRWSHRQVSIAPVGNLITYIGFREDASHTRGTHAAAGRSTHMIARPLQHPTDFTANAELDRATARLLFYEGGYFPWLEYQWNKRVLRR